MPRYPLKPDPIIETKKYAVSVKPAAMKAALASANISLAAVGISIHGFTKYISRNLTPKFKPDQRRKNSCEKNGEQRHRSEAQTSRETTTEPVGWRHGWRASKRIVLCCAIAIPGSHLPLAENESLFSLFMDSPPSKSPGQTDVEEADNASQGEVASSAPMSRPSTVPMRASSVPLHFKEYTAGYVYSSEMLGHLCLKGHPEQPERIARIFQAIKDANFLVKMKQLATRPVTRSEVLLVHSEDHWDKVLDIQCEYGWNLLSHA